MHVDRSELVEREIRRRIADKRRGSITGGWARGLALAGGVGLVAFASGWIASPSSTRVYDFSIVTPGAIHAHEPRIVERWRDRIVYRELEPEYGAVAPEGALETLEAFCRPSRSRGLAVPDSSSQGSGELLEGLERRFTGPQLPRSFTLEPPLLWGRTELRLFSVTPEGHLLESGWKVGGPTRVLAGDTLIVRSSRFWPLREGLKIGVPLAAGYVLGRLVF